MDIFHSKLGKILQKNLKKKKLRPRPPSFFFSYIAQSLLSLKIYLRKVLELLYPYKKFMSENTEFRCFRAYMHPKIKIFG